MTVKVFIPKTLPNLNDYINAERSNRYKGAQVKKDSQLMCCLFINQQCKGKRFERPVFIQYKWIEKNKRRDPDNISGFGHKAINDALVVCGVLKDDGWDEIAGYTDLFEVNKQRPGIEIMITDEFVK